MGRSNVVRGPWRCVDPSALPPVPAWACACCGEPVGILGNWIAWLFGVRTHGCTFQRWIDAGITTAERVRRMRA